MKTFITLIVALTLVTPAALSAAAFEGTVKMKMSPTSGQTMPITFSMKSGLSRVEIEAAPGQGVVTIIDPTKQEATMLMPQQKMYMVHSLAAKENPGAAEKQSDATFEKTNQHEKILGYDTTKYIAKSKGTTTEIWATEELGTFSGMSAGGPMGGMGGGKRGGNSAQAWENALRGKDVFPLRIVSNGSDGKESFRMEATDVKKQSLPDTLFTVPEDYQKLDMGNMMRGMMPGMPGRPKQGQQQQQN